MLSFWAISTVRRSAWPRASKSGCSSLFIASQSFSSTGRSVRTTVATGPRSPVIHAATSSTLLIVAESPMKRMCFGAWTMTSSHTVPRG